MDKEIKQIIKSLRFKFSTDYEKAVEALLNGYITADDMMLYIDNEASVPARINQIREDLTRRELEASYKKITSGEYLATNEFITKLDADLKVLDAEYTALLKTSAYTPEDAKIKLKKIEFIEKRMEHYNKILNDLELSKNEYQPKKKPGRPKKNKAKEQSTND